MILVMTRLSHTFGVLWLIGCCKMISDGLLLVCLHVVSHPAGCHRLIPRDEQCTRVFSGSARSKFVVVPLAKASSIIKRRMGMYGKTSNADCHSHLCFSHL